ncbi:hypothetical protein RHGRI_007550 [Rhododendron griersonianum]|uniref:Aminotransferase-like plant mobile domain-containing protein n=1 Tax=Rhododendron griersonianum TaxID=479676 RepID=A0AAV6KXA2_9ERIC|nr:hypothetical protein RHGRI_007550 [Rhododendron griersonianum]
MEMVVAKEEQRANEVIPSLDESRFVGDDHHLVLSGLISQVQTAVDAIRKSATSRMSKLHQEMSNIQDLTTSVQEEWTNYIQKLSSPELKANRIEDIPDGTAATPKQTSGWSGSASCAEIKFDSEKDKPPPPFPGLEFWFRAPYLGGGDKLWRLVEADLVIGKVVDKPVLGYKKVAVEEACFISPKSVLRFQVERGEFPRCFSAYRNYVVPPAAFATRADDILGNADFVELLRKADVHRAVMNSLRLVILRERKWMDVVVSRWSTDSHTLPVAWGETGPTLEDVGCLLRLPMLGKVDPSSRRLSPSQQGVADALQRSVRREKGHGGVKNTFIEWARYWYKDLGVSKAGEEAHVVTNGPGLKESAHLAAFLAYWLTWYIFPGPPKDGVDTTLFELAAILASKESVPLAPLFLGTLFKRLDMLHDAAQRSCGRYDLPIYVATNILHMFLFERFPRVAPESNDFGADDSGGKGEPC